jgi:hypothetical protein
VTLAVYTAIFGGRDRYREPPPSDYDCHVFSDGPLRTSHATVHVGAKAKNHRRASRRMKILPHEFLDHDYTLWIDGSLRLLKAPPIALLDDVDIALFRHHVRQCIYAEAEVCARLRLDDPAVIRAQVERYRAERCPSNAGLVAGGFLFRRMTETMRAFDEAWWAEYERGCCRDQVSFGYVAWKMGLKIRYIPGSVISNPYTTFMGHAAAPAPRAPVPPPRVQPVTQTSRRAAVMEARWQQMKDERARMRVRR